MRAMSALAAEIPVKPNSAATIEITKKINAHFSRDTFLILYKFRYVFENRLPS